MAPPATGSHAGGSLGGVDRGKKGGLGGTWEAKSSAPRVLEGPSSRDRLPAVSAAHPPALTMKQITRKMGNSTGGPRQVLGL